MLRSAKNLERVEGGGKPRRERQPSPCMRRIVFSAFVGLGTLIKLTQHKARELQYNFLCPIVVISVAKLTCSLALYAWFDGPLHGLPGHVVAARGVVLRYAVVAALFCLYDVLSFVNLGIFDPATYLMFLQLRTVITGAVWEVAFAKKLSWLQRGALALICLACIAKQTRAGSGPGTAAAVPLTSHILLALQVVANCMAGVANELLLKSKGEVPLNLQNAVQYSWTIVWCLLIGTVCPLEGIRLNPLDLQEWVKMVDPRMLPNILVLTLLGLVTSVLLKVLDSIWKAIATAVELFLTSYASALAFGYPVHTADLAALCIAATGVGLYAWPAAKVRPGPAFAKRDSEV
mmetsp:Transcript_15653/g.49497  ORF Transcript_15653/g.49497 Transcript_15653/m.49497 type:complete len:347 (+) Transcript_15653:36-1076(+)